MESILETATIFSLVAPIMMGLTCVFILTLYRRDNREPDIRLITKILILQLISAVIGWLCTITFWTATYLFVYLQWLFVPSIVYSQILTYRYIYIHTRTKSHDDFAVWHYLWPLIPGVIFLISIFIYPQAVREYIVEGRPLLRDDAHFYNIITQTVPFLFLMTNIIYSILAIYRISYYRKEIINYSADESHTSLRWLKLMVFITLSSIPLGLIPILFGINTIVSLTLSIIGMTAIIFKGVLPIYNIMNREYVLIFSSTQEANSEVNFLAEKKTSNINSQTFEHYMLTQKPYLNPDLRITDLLRPLETNRTYLSAFINTEYGTNFSRYINKLRLKELESLHKMPENAHLEARELVERVGFRNYRNYLRFKKEEDKNSSTSEN